MLVETLALPVVARHINKSLRKTTQKRGSGLAVHTSGLNCHWLKVVIALEVMIFLAFCGLSFCGRKTSLSGKSLYSGPEQKCPQLLRPTPGSGLCTRDQSQAIRPPSIVSQADRLQGRGETNAGQ